VYVGADPTWTAFTPAEWATVSNLAPTVTIGLRGGQSASPGGQAGGASDQSGSVGEPSGQLSGSGAGDGSGLVSSH
jgi:hypothetical protein